MPLTSQSPHILATHLHNSLFFNFYVVFIFGNVRVALQQQLLHCAVHLFEL